VVVVVTVEVTVGLVMEAAVTGTAMTGEVEVGEVATPPPMTTTTGPTMAVTMTTDTTEVRAVMAGRPVTVWITVTGVRAVTGGTIDQQGTTDWFTSHSLVA